MTVDAGTRWDKTVELFMSTQYPDLPIPRMGKDCGIGIVIRRHRLFQPGDVVLMNYWNGGGERQLIFCRTQRGYSIKMYYLQYRHYRRLSPTKEKVYDGVMKPVDLPGELVGLSPTDPAIRHFVLSLTSEICREPGKLG